MDVPEIHMPSSEPCRTQVMHDVHFITSLSTASVQDVSADVRSLCDKGRILHISATELRESASQQ